MKVRIINSFESVLKRGSFSPLRKINKLKEVTKPLTADSYSSAEEKINDIYLDQKASGYYTKTIEQNIEKFDKLPESVKKAVEVNDVDINGFVNQDKINKAWSAAKKSNAYDMRLESDIPPRFNGRLEHDDIHDSADSTIDLVCDGDNGMAAKLLDSDEPAGNILSKVADWLNDIIN